ncbi:hypothetical protein SynBIOSU31_00865 [Synechococcus sp. BIOS-U3-1]|nr:hypothetical protein SynBIOSU31_00865 [Synechococcus sp. BIOS-U3-1]
MRLRSQKKFAQMGSGRSLPLINRLHKRFTQPQKTRAGLTHTRSIH